LVLSPAGNAGNNSRLLRSPNRSINNAASATNAQKPISSTISRFACRILADREQPIKAYVYAAGFDSSKNIFLGVTPYSL
jgi:pellino protein